MANGRRNTITLYTNYYHPDTASLAMLCRDLADGLKDEYDVTVICSVPCYDGSVDEKYRNAKYEKEEFEGYEIIRVGVPPFDKRNKKSRVKNILAFFFRAIGATWKADKADMIITESQPPILGGLIGVFAKWINILRFKKSKMIYVIQDYNPEQTMAVGYSSNGMVLKAMMAADKFSCRMADKVVVVGRDMVETMKKRFSKGRVPETVFINNWMSGEDAHPLPSDDQRIAAFKKKYGLEGKFVIMYSGNIGLFYDLENLFKVVEQFKDNDEVVFPFIGEGSLKKNLEEYAKEHGMKNVVFIPYQDKKDISYSLGSADVHWIVNAKGIKGVSCPSKLYGILSVAKPSLAVLEEGSEAREIIETTKSGFAVSPNDYDGVRTLIEKYIELWKADPEELSRMGERGHAYMQSHLTKEISIEKYRKEIRNLL